MCGSKHQRERWERELEREAERIRLISTTKIETASNEPDWFDRSFQTAEEPEPEVESEERETELVRS